MTEVENSIKVGDRVAYLLSDGERVSDAQGKVLGIIRTLDGKTLADVQWTHEGVPKRVSVTMLIRQ